MLLTEVNPHLIITNLFLRNEIRKFLDDSEGAPSPCPSAPEPITKHQHSSESRPPAQLKRHNSADVNVTAVAGMTSPMEADAARLVQVLSPSGRAGNKTARKNAVAELYQLSAVPEQAAAIVAAGGLDALCPLLHEHSNTLNLLAASTLANIAAVDDAQCAAIDRSGAVWLMWFIHACIHPRRWLHWWRSWVAARGPADLRPVRHWAPLPTTPTCAANLAAYDAHFESLSGNAFTTTNLRCQTARGPLSSCYGMSRAGPVQPRRCLC